MAQRVQIELVDDITGETAQETMHFSVDGTDYEIDLTTENAGKLRSCLSDYIAKGRKVSARRGQGARQSAPASRGGQTSLVRQWAQENGYKPNARGRLNQAIVDAYNQAQK